jgi:hypothetical protein
MLAGLQTFGGTYCLHLHLQLEATSNVGRFTNFWRNVLSSSLTDKGYFQCWQVYKLLEERTVFIFTYRWRLLPMLAGLQTFGETYCLHLHLQMGATFNVEIQGDSGPNISLYICTVHTAVLFQSLAAIYCQTHHVEY